MRTRMLSWLPGPFCGIVFGLAVVSASASAQTTAPNEWTWMGGSSTIPSCSQGTTCGRPGNYGTLGTPDTSNIPGGRDSSVGWTDQNGNFWLFGGEGSDAMGASGELNDLWEYAPTAYAWTWEGGSNTIGNNCSADTASNGLPYCGQPGVYGTLGTPDSKNIPGGRYGAVSWTDASGNFWLFGGQGFDSVGAFGALNDLWEFIPSTKTWTWISGSGVVNQPGVYGSLGKSASGNIPGARFDSNSWIDGNGSLWLFGGWGYDSAASEADLNDLWVFNSSTKQWTWMNGSSQAGGNGAYGAIGTPAPGNTPNSRFSAVGWTDRNGNFWLMSGEGYSSTSQAATEAVSRAHSLDTGGIITWTYYPPATYADLWEFDIAAQEWILISPDAINGVPGTLGVPSAANGPSGSAIAYTDNSGNSWILSPGFFNSCYDLMDFNPSTLEWAWMGGSCSSLGVYGTEGAPAAGDFPGGRGNSVGWTDSQGDFWLFGGSGADSAGNVGDLNDLWVYQPSATTLPPAITPYINENGGTGGAFNYPLSVEIYNGMTNAVFYYTTDGTTPTTSSAETTDWITLAGPAILKVIAVAPGYPNSDVASATFIQEPTTATPTFSVASGTYNSVQMVTLSDTTPNASFEYSVNFPGDSSLYFQPYSGPISVSFTETLTAIASANGYNGSARATATYTIPTSFTLAATPASLSVTGGENGTATVSITPLNGFRSEVTFACSGLPAGASCSFAPQTVTPDGGVVSTTLTVTTSTTMAAIHRNAGPLFPMSTLAVLVCCIGWKKRRLVQILPLLLVGAVTLGLLTGCSGSSGGGSPGHQPVTSTVTVNATSGSLQQSASFSLTVN